MKQHTTDEFLIGSWVSFYPFSIDSYEYQLDQMAAAGLNFNIFPYAFGGGTDSTDWDAVEKQYAARDMYYFMAGGLSEPMRREGVSLAAGKSRCIGYHLLDEPPAALLPAVGEHIRAYRAADGQRFPFVNLFPSYVGEEAMEGNYPAYVARFLREAGAENIEYLSHDFYALRKTRTVTSIFADMEVIRRAAFENGRMRTHAFPQSTAWAWTRMPNIDEMRWNAYGYLAYGFKALSWFNLVCPGTSDTEGEGFSDSLIYRDGTVRDPVLFSQFGELNREISTLGKTLMRLDTVHAYHTKGGIDGVELLPADWAVTPTDEADFIISHMESRDGDTYIMLFSKDWAHSVTATFRFRMHDGAPAPEYVNPATGTHEPAALQGDMLTVSFRPGEGKLYRWCTDIA